MPQEASQEASHERPERPKSLIFICFFDVFRFLAFSASRRSKTAPEAPKTAPRRPKRAPRGPPDGPRRPQDGPRGAQDGPRGPQDGPKRGPRAAQDGLRRPQDSPRGAQDGPRSAQDGSRGPQDGPKRGPRAGPRTKNSSFFPPESPRRPQEAPKRPQEAAKRPPSGPKRPPRGPNEAPKLPPRAFRTASQRLPRGQPRLHIFLRRTSSPSSNQAPNRQLLPCPCHSHQSSPPAFQGRGSRQYQVLVASPHWRPWKKRGLRSLFIVP